MGKIFNGFIITTLGFIMIWKTSWLIQNFGTNAWAEAKLGSSGGTRLMYKLLGLIIMFFGMLMITGLSEGFLMGTVGKLFINR